MEFGVWQCVLVALSGAGFITGLLDRQGRVIERVLLIGGGFGLMLLDIVLNFVASALSMVPSRSIGEILLFHRSPPGDVLIPVAYVLIAIGIGSLLRKLVDTMLESVGRAGD